MKTKARNSSSLPRRPLQENLAKLDRILNEIDDIDGSVDAYESHGMYIYILFSSVFLLMFIFLK